MPQQPKARNHHPASSLASREERLRRGKPLAPRPSPLHPALALCWTAATGGPDILGTRR
jgi:hypothetical protein